jgi:hypothetical protein
MDRLRKTIIIGLLALFMAPDPLGAQKPPLAEITPDAQQLLKQIANRYKQLAAYGDEGRLIFTATLNDKSETKEAKTPLQFIRPNILMVNYGRLALRSDGEMFRMVGYGQKQIYERPLAREPGFKVDPQELTKSEQESNQKAKTFSGKALGTMPSEPEQLLQAMAGSIIVPVLTFLMEDEPETTLRRGPKAILTDVEKKFLRIQYADATEYHLIPDPETGLVRQIKMIIPEGQRAKLAPPGKTLTKLEITWESGKIARDRAQVQAQMNERRNSEPLPTGFETIRDNVCLAGDHSLVPKPPNSPPTLFELIRRLFGLSR